MIRLLVFTVATLAALFVVMSIYGAGSLRKTAPVAETPRPAAQDAGRENFVSAQPESRPAPIAEAGDPAPELVKASVQTPEKVQKFPGPPLRPSPEHAGRATQEPAAPPPGAQGPVLYVTGNSVNFRAGPSTGDRVIGALGRGEAVEALGPTDTSWVNIRDTQGRIGYISGQFLSGDAPN